MDANELFGAKTPMAGDLADGLKTLALDQKIRFRLYGRVILPVDGFVFWVAAPLLAQKPFKQSGLVTASTLSKDDMEPCAIEATGSLHYTADVRQEEAETYAANRVVFTSLEEVEGLNAIAPGTMWVGEFDGLRFGFSSLSMRYRQAGLWHYSGFAIYPDMEPQLVDDARLFSSAQVVSNSLPAWLAIAAYQPAWSFWGPLPTLFPSFLAPQNEAPPFATVHVLPEGTQALASAPTIDQRTSTHVQLCSDRVRVTFWGARNDQALDFVDALNQYSHDTGAIGIMNVPVIRDEKRIQAELNVIAQKKVMDVEVSYLQHRMRTLGQQVIRQATAKFFVDHKPV
jgi:hypothetical protein